MLSAHLSSESRSYALSAAHTIHHEDARAVALCGFGADLMEEQLDELLAAAKSIREGVDRARALGALARHLTGEQFKRLWQPEWPLARSMLAATRWSYWHLI
jgi:hypothetical protein